MSSQHFSSFSELASFLGVSDIPISWRQAHDAIQASGSRHICPFDIEFIEATACDLKIEPSLRCMIRDAAIRINGSDLLSTIAEIAQYLLFDSPERESVAAEDYILPPLPMFYVPIFLTAVPALMKRHADRGIPESSTRLLLTDIERWIHEHHARFGEWDFSEMKWLKHHFWGDLFQVGVLQLQFSTFQWPYRVYSNRNDGAPLVVVDGIHEFRADGQFPDADLSSYYPCSNISSQRFTTRLYEDSGDIVAHRVKPDGTVSSDEMRFIPGSDGVRLGLGDQVLAVHIPGGGPLIPELIDASFDGARDFFRRYFPEFKPRGFTTHTWLLDPQLSDYLPADSNIVRFQRRFFLLPARRADDCQHFERIFHVPVSQVADQPRDTRLKRALFDHIDSGGCWRSTCGVIPYPAESFSRCP